MIIVSLILSVLAIIIAVLGFIMRKPGPQGLKGDPGDKGEKGDDADIPMFKIENGNIYVKYKSPEGAPDYEWVKLGYVQGKDGINGKDGKDGKDGARGPKGDPGKDGILLEGALTADKVVELLNDLPVIELPNSKLIANEFHQHK